MKIKAIVPAFGGKRTMAPDICEQLGPHAAYWEPFCLSLAVLFAKEPAGHETVNDLHGDVINLAMVLASDRWHDLHARLCRVLYADRIFDYAKKRFLAGSPPVPGSPLDVWDFHVDRAFQFMIVSWIGRNGVAGTKRVNYQMALRWTPNGGSGSTRFVSAVDSIPEWHERLRSVMILNRDALVDVLPNISDEPGVAIYADPPYLLDSRSGGGGSAYEHDFTDADHIRLAKQLRRFKRARIVVSYYAHDRLERLYPRWTVIDCNRHKHLHVQNKRGSTRKVAPEVLLINGPVMTNNKDLPF
jgi:DNA adenine methylase